MEHNFENFVVDDCNKIAFNVCKSTAEELPYTLYNPLYIYGDDGTGKTHLMKSIINYLKDNNSKVKVLYLNNNDILKYSREILEDLEKIKEKTVEYDLIIFDDIFNNYDSTSIKKIEEQYCELFDYLLLNYKTMIFTGNIEIEELKKIYTQLGSRMEQGMCVKVFPQINK